jgi:hypothetical protein
MPLIVQVSQLHIVIEGQSSNLLSVVGFAKLDVATPHYVAHQSMLSQRFVFGAFVSLIFQIVSKCHHQFKFEIDRFQILAGMPIDSRSALLAAQICELPNAPQ